VQGRGREQIEQRKLISKNTQKGPIYVAKKRGEEGTKGRNHRSVPTEEVRKAEEDLGRREVKGPGAQEEIAYAR